MIKQSLFTIALLSNLFSYAQEEKHHAEEISHSITVGIAAPYSSELETVGFNTRIYYNLSHSICFGPEISYFMKDDSEALALDLVAHYIIETELVGFYPLLGSNYTVETEEYETARKVETSFGMVYGAGIHKSFNKLTAFAQYSRVEFGIDDEIFTLGLMCNFK